MGARNLLIVRWDEVIDVQPGGQRPSVVVAEAASQSDGAKPPERLTHPGTVFSVAPIFE
jgi:hypothetical protein